MQLRVIDADGEPPHLVRVTRPCRRSLGLAIIPLFAGFIPVLFDARRRGAPGHGGADVVMHAPAMIPGALSRSTLV